MPVVRRIVLWTLLLLSLLPFDSLWAQDTTSAETPPLPVIDSQAEKYYLEALKLEPKYVTALRGLGRTYTAVGKIPDAIDTLEKAIKSAPQFAGSYLDLGRAYVAAGHYQNALDAFNKVMELDPESPFAREAKEEAHRLTGG